MEHPADLPSSSSPEAADASSPGGQIVWSRARLIFWIVSSPIIVALGVVNISWWGQEARTAARRKELQDLWPTVFRILEQTPSMDIIALNPQGVGDEAETFHGYGVLGRATIRDAGDIKALAGAFLQGRRAGGRAFACFDPRHGIHVRRGDQDLDLVICFECEQGYLYFGSFNGRWYGISESPRPSFDRAFQKAGLRVTK
jgi:hypothetical protein